MLRVSLVSLVAGLVLFVCRTDIKAAAPADQTRRAWLYHASDGDGVFTKENDNQWIEEGSGGTQFQFEEAARTAGYIELFDPGRKMWLRLYSDHAEWRQGEQPQWNGLYRGRWVDAAKLTRRAKSDCRIRLVYFVPTDRQPTPEYAKKIRVVMQIVSELYRQDFEARRIPSPGLRFQIQHNEVVVHLVRGSHTAAFYNDAPNYDPQNQWKKILPEIPPSVGALGKNLIVVFAETYDSGPAAFEWPGGVALGNRSSADGGVGLFSAWILRPEFCATTVPRQKELLFDATPIEGRTALGHGRPNSPRFEFIEDGFGAVAHELGHAMGLPHDHRQDHLEIMGNGFRNLRWNFTTPLDPGRRVRFSDDNARLLATSRYLAPDAVLTDRLAPTVALRWAAPLHAGDTTVRLSVTASDNEGLRALLFFTPAEDSVVGGRSLAGKTIAFDESLSVKPLKPGPFWLEAYVADAGGNLSRLEIKGTVEP